MRVSKYIICFIVLAIVAVIPMILSYFEPLNTILDDIGDIILLDYYWGTTRQIVSFSARLIPTVLFTVIMAVGSFINYCIYKNFDCTWTRKKLNESILVDLYLNKSSRKNESANIKCMEGNCKDRPINMGCDPSIDNKCFL